MPPRWCSSSWMAEKWGGRDDVHGVVRLRRMTTMPSSASTKRLGGSQTDVVVVAGDEPRRGGTAMSSSYAMRRRWSWRSCGA
jgi:hypothetical protein